MGHLVVRGAAQSSQRAVATGIKTNQNITNHWTTVAAQSNKSLSSLELLDMPTSYGIL